VPGLSRDGDRVLVAAGGVLCLWWGWIRGEDVTERILLRDLRLDGETQTRAAMNQGRVAEYADLMKDGEEFPPIIVFFDGTVYWVADGFHRAHGAKQAGRVHIEADVRQGTKADCIRFAVGANKEYDHAGLRRSSADKRRAVEMYLTLIWGEGKDESSRTIAEACGVGDWLVKAVKNELGESPSSPPRPERVIAKNGKMHPATKRKTDTKDDTAPEPAPVSEPAPSRNPAVRPRSAAMIALDAKVQELTERGYGTGDIAKEVGANPHRVSESKRRLGMTRAGLGNPLAGLTETASEHVGVWEFALETLNHKMSSATQQQRDALSDELKGLTRAVKRLVSVLAKSEERETESC
jgi:hypothetical protein